MEDIIEQYPSDLNYEHLFQDVCDESNYADRITATIEKEFKSMGLEKKEREDEKKALEQELIALKKDYRKCKNIRNTKMAKANQSNAAKRKIIREKMEYVKMRLEEIGDEEKGSEIDPSVMTSLDS